MMYLFDKLMDGVELGLDIAIVVLLIICTLLCLIAVFVAPFPDCLYAVAIGGVTGKLTHQAYMQLLAKIEQIKIELGV